MAQYRAMLLGTWEQRTGKDGLGYYATFKIKGTVYKGVFFKQYDESKSHNEVDDIYFDWRRRQIYMGQ